MYFDGFNNDQKQAKPADDSWATNVLGGELGAVGFHNEVTYASGTWWAASYDFTNNTLFIRTLQ